MAAPSIHIHIQYTNNSILQVKCPETIKFESVTFFSDGTRGGVVKSIKTKVNEDYWKSIWTRAKSPVLANMFGQLIKVSYKVQGSLSIKVLCC